MLEPEDGNPQSADIWVGVIFSMLLNSFHLDTSNPFIFAYILFSAAPFFFQKRRRISMPGGPSCRPPGSHPTLQPLIVLISQP
jgi:hypothetical protein